MAESLFKKLLKDLPASSPGLFPAAFALYGIDILVFPVIRHEEPVLECYQIKGTASHATVCKIEHGSEELERMTTYPWQPVRECRVYDREIEHVHHLAEHERCIMPAQTGNRPRSGFGEYEPIEKVIDKL